VTANSNVIDIGSMSLGGSGSDTDPDDPMHNAIKASVNRGVTYTVAAGNNGIDAANFVPAAYDEVITVSAYDASSGEIGFPWWSNYGTDVDIAAPGVSIYSTYKNGGYAVLSGTSMAAPHAAAAAALYLRNNPDALPAEVRTALINAGENGYTGQGGLHPERLLNVSQFH
jgi:subtilisin family serine protease